MNENNYKLLEAQRASRVIEQQRQKRVQKYLEEMRLLELRDQYEKDRIEYEKVLKLYYQRLILRESLYQKISTHKQAKKVVDLETLERIRYWELKQAYYLQMEQEYEHFLNEVVAMSEMEEHKRKAYEKKRILDDFHRNMNVIRQSDNTLQGSDATGKSYYSHIVHRDDCTKPGRGDFHRRPQKCVKQHDGQAIVDYANDRPRNPGGQGIEEQSSKPVLSQGSEGKRQSDIQLSDLDAKQRSTHVPAGKSGGHQAQKYQDTPCNALGVSGHRQYERSIGGAQSRKYKGREQAGKAGYEHGAQRGQYVANRPASGNKKGKTCTHRDVPQEGATSSVQAGAGAGIQGVPGGATATAAGAKSADKAAACNVGEKAVSQGHDPAHAGSTGGSSGGPPRGSEVQPDTGEQGPLVADYYQHDGEQQPQQAREPQQRRTPLRLPLDGLLVESGGYQAIGQAKQNASADALYMGAGAAQRRKGPHSTLSQSITDRNYATYQDYLRKKSVQPYRQDQRFDEARRLSQRLAAQREISVQRLVEKQQKQEMLDQYLQQQMQYEIQTKRRMDRLSQINSLALKIMQTKALEERLHGSGASKTATSSAEYSADGGSGYY